jgi:flagellar biosynthesis anti-sigma factor FlgM
VDTGSTSPTQKTNSAEVSVDVSLSIADKVKSMSSEPPIDIQLVNEIRQKVAEGRYPIDVSAISSKMFESIKNG